MAKHFFVFAIIYSISILFGKVPLYDPDIGWHIQAGYQIRELGHIPKFDIWTFASDQRWYNLSWLFDVFASYADQFLGLKNLNLFTYFWFALLGTLIFRNLENLKIGNDAKMVTLTLIMLVLFEIWYLRPQIATYFLLLGLIELLNKHSMLRMALLFLLTMLWSNIHGSFLIVFITIGAFGIEAIVEKNYTRVKQLLISAVIACLATLCTPYGYEIYFGVIRTLDSNITSYISEWRPFTFGIQYGFSLIVAVLLLISNANIKISIANKLLAFFWLFYALASIRCFGYFAIAAIPYLALSIEQNIFKSLYEIKLSDKVKCTIATILIVTSLTIYPFKKIEHAYAHDAVEWLNKNAQGKKIYNVYNFGGLIAYYGNGKYKYFIDGRAGTAFSEDVLNEHLAFVNQEKDWQNHMKKYNFDYAMIYKNALKFHDIHEYFKKWKTSYQDDVVVILKKPK